MSLLSVPKPTIGIYRTVFPLRSETFISEQIRAFATYQAVIICRDLLESNGAIPAIAIEGRFRALNRVRFTVFGSIRGFGRLADLEKLRLIHAHFAPDAVLALSLARKLRIPLIVTCHGSDVTTRDLEIVKDGKLSGYRYLFGREQLFEYGSKFIAVSEFLRKKMIQSGFPQHKVIKHYVGIDTSRFVPRIQDRSALNDAPYILSVARHTSVKGIDLLLKAFSIVLRSNPTLRLIQIGSGTLTRDLKLLAKELKIGRNVSFLGALPSAQVLPYVQHCNALVLSSRRTSSGAEEAFGLVLTEASSCGVPCIGTRVGGIPEAVVHGETGFLTEPEDVYDLAEKIAQVVSNPDLANSMGRRGRELACDVFDLRKQTRSLESMYAELL